LYAPTSGNAGAVTGIVPVANGGTGSATQNFVDLTTAQTVAGAKTFSSDLTVNELTVGRGGGDIISNTAVGAATLQSNTTGNYNTAVGAGSFYMNDSGSFNTAIGSMALFSNTEGNYNTANGIYALYSNTSGKNNTANGDSTLFSNTTGNYNTANGSMALSSNTEGIFNTAIGVVALNSTTVGVGNTAIGVLALHSNTTGYTNTGIGAGADVASGALTNATAIGSGAVVDLSNTIQLGNADITNVKTSGTITAGDVTYPNTDGTTGKVLTANGSGTPTWAAGGVPYTGATDTVDLGAYDLTVNGLTVGKGHLSVGDNTAIGNGALHSNTTGDYNTATGAYSLYFNTTGYSNTATGQGALNSNTTGHNNTANGTGALNYNITGNQNTATGKGALQYNLTGSFNTANGLSALETNGSGSSNTAYGSEALVSNTTGDGNTAIGVGSLFSNTSGNSNTAIGANADVLAVDLTNATAIGSGAIVAASNTIQLGNADVTNVKTSGTLTAGAVTYPNIDGTANQVLTTDGSGAASWVTPSTTATAYSGTLPVANGGTGSATQNFVDLTTDQTVAGAKTFSSDLTVNGLTIGKGAGSIAYNTAIGVNALNSNTTGLDNTANGNGALQSNTEGNQNTANGYIAMIANTTGSLNTANGIGALQSNQTGSNNTAIGSYANVGGVDLINATAIGSNAVVSASNTIQLGNTSVANVKTSGTLTAGAVTYPNIDGTANQVLTTDGSGAAAWVTPSTTATAYSGTLPVANGGTGSATQNFVDLTTDQTVAGAKTFSSDLTVNANESISGNQTVGGTLGVTGATTVDVLSAGATTLSSNTVSGNETVGGTLSVTGLTTVNQLTTGNITVGGIETITGNLEAYGTIKAGSVTYPNTDGAADQVLTTNGSGALSWVTPTYLSNGTTFFSTLFWTGNQWSSSNNLLNTGSAVEIIGDITNSNGIYRGPEAQLNMLEVSSNETVGGTLTVTGETTTGSLTAGEVTYPNTHGTSGQVLSTNGSGTLSWVTPSTTATAYSGTLPVANGGTGSATQNFVDLTTAQTVAGAKTFSSDLTVNGLTVGNGAGIGNHNVAIGQISLASNTTGTENTATGYNALNSNSTGGANTANGALALLVNTNGEYNTATGFRALVDNTEGSKNMATGAFALSQNTSGSFNTANGYSTMYANKTGSNNTAIGSFADVASEALTNATALGNGAIVAASNTIQLGNTSVTNVKTSGTLTAGAVTYPNTDGTANQILKTNGSGVLSWTTPSTTATAYSGVLPVANGGTGSSTQNFVDLSTAQTVAGAKTFSSDLTVNDLTIGKGGGSIAGNTAIGHTALNSNTTGYRNTASGFASLYSNTIGSDNSANGTQALYSNTFGQSNTANGTLALYANTTGNYNTANGTFSLKSNTTGVGNVANGYSALFSNTTGSYNIGNGANALRSNTTGFNNTVNGYNALYVNTTGSNNSVNGYQALFFNTTGDYNTADGASSLFSNNTGTNNTAIGYGADVSSGGLNNATAIGSGAIVTGSNTIQLGNTDVTNVNTSGTLTAGAVTYTNTTGTNGYYLKTDGAGVTSWAPAIVTTILPIANGGTGSATQNFVDLSTAQTVAGDKTLSGNTSVGGILQVSGNTTIAGSAGIGTASPNSKAILDVSSTTKGFLPPRMTHAQMMAITGAPAGLMVWCSDLGSSGMLQVYNGTDWTNLNGVIVSGTVPDAPTISTATRGYIGVGEAYIPFTKPASNGGSPITSYTVISSPGNITETLYQTGSDTFHITGLTLGISYTFTVRATNALGSATSAASNSVTPDMYIGDTYGGGKIAYFLQAGDPGYVSGQKHGLIVSTVTMGGYGMDWSLPAFDSTSVPGGTSTQVGSGLANTNKIIAQNGPGNNTDNNYDARVARAYNGGGYSDWYLPSKDELDKVYMVFSLVGSFVPNDFTYFVSSTEFDATEMWHMNFGTGAWVHNHKWGFMYGWGSGSLLTLPVRSF
jgi:hypothetical protein